MLIDHLSQQLQQRRELGLERVRRIAEGPCRPDLPVSWPGTNADAATDASQPMLAFCSNDYLGLAAHPAVVEALAEGARRWGAGSGASHLVCGHGRAHERLEQALAEWLAPLWPEGARVLGFGTGYLANLALMTALGDARTTLFTDRLNHASLIDGAQLARAEVRRYPHNRVDRLEAMLAECATPLKLIVTDGVFSMDGDLAPLDRLLALAERHDAWLVVDDAHGLGVLGEAGRGSLAHFGLRGRRLILMGTLGKAFGVAGAFVMADPVIVEWLLQTARPGIYTTAAPPALAEATRASLEIIRGPEGDARRAALQARIRQLREGLAALLAAHPDCGWSLPESATAIQPLLIGDNHRAAALAERLRQAGLWVPAIRPPTVPEGTARLRITLSAAHRPEEVARLLAVLGQALQDPAGGPR